MGPYPKTFGACLLKIFALTIWGYHKNKFLQLNLSKNSKFFQRNFICLCEKFSNSFMISRRSLERSTYAIL